MPSKPSIPRRKEFHGRSFYKELHKVFRQISENKAYAAFNAGVPVTIVPASYQVVFGDQGNPDVLRTTYQFSTWRTDLAQRLSASMLSSPPWQDPLPKRIWDECILDSAYVSGSSRITTRSSFLGRGMAYFILLEPEVQVVHAASPVPGYPFELRYSHRARMNHFIHYVGAPNKTESKKLKQMIGQAPQDGISPRGWSEDDYNFYS